MAEPRMTHQLRRWHLMDQAALIRTLVEGVRQHADTAIAARDAFHLVLAGGSTPAQLYRELAGLDTDWRAWWIYFGDERCLPAGDGERNDTMARGAWLDQVAIPPAQILSVPAHLGANAAAEEYARTVAACQQFDLVLLGVGEDGHTASLFPGHAAFVWRSEADEAADAPVAQTIPAAIPVYAAPKPPPERVSLSAPRLSAARAVWFLATGAGKRDALQRWHRGEPLPVAAIAPPAGVDIFTDLDPTAD